MPQRRQAPPQQLAPQEAYLGDYSALAQQFLRKKDKPIYSAGQGIAEALGDVGEAYFLRKAAEKDQRREDRDLSAVAMALQFASNPNLTRVGVNDAMGQERTIANSIFDRPADPNERYAGAMAQIKDNPRAQIAAGPGVMDLAKQFTPPTRFEDVDLGNGGRGQRDPRTNALTQVVPRQAPAQSPLARLMAERDSLPPSDPRRAQYDAAISQATTRQPGSVQTAQTKDGLFVLNPDGTLGNRLGDLPAREAMPKMQTYFDEEGGTIQLDSNDPADQAIIRERGLVTDSPNDSQRVAKGFLDRMAAAEPNMQAVVDAGYDPSNLRDKMLQGNVLGNYGVSEKGQLYRQAQEDWVRAKLRKESGAVIGDDEMEREIKTYFAQPGDAPSVQQQKFNSRIQAQRQLATTAGILGRKFLRDAAQGAGPAVGTVEDGYRFKGGNASDPANWERM